MDRQRKNKGSNDDWRTRCRRRVITWNEEMQVALVTAQLDATLTEPRAALQAGAGFQARSISSQLRPPVIRRS